MYNSIYAIQNIYPIFVGYLLFFICPSFCLSMTSLLWSVFPCLCFNVSFFIKKSIFFYFGRNKNVSKKKVKKEQDFLKIFFGFYYNFPITNKHQTFGIIRGIDVLGPDPTLK